MKHDASIWIGYEEEYDEKGLKMFIDEANITQIYSALEEYPEVNHLHFAHDFHDRVATEFENKLEITLEVEKVEDVPAQLRGKVNVILRVPSWIDQLKVKEGSSIEVYDMSKHEPDQRTTWHGQKVYPDDEVIL